MSRFLVFITLAFCSALSARAVSPAPGFLHYDNFALDARRWRLPTSFTISMTEPWMLQGNERVDLTICDSRSDYICFAGEGISFFVPKSTLAIGKKWSKKGAEFEVIQEFVFGQLGQEIPVLRVRATPIGPGVLRDFLYSCERGLIAIDEIDTERRAVEHYVLREERGFGAGMGACSVEKRADGTTGTE